MQRGRAAAAAAEMKAAAPAPRRRSTAAMDEYARAMAARRKLAHEAAQCAFENGVGAKAALNTDQFKGAGLTYNMVHPLLAELKAPGKNVRVDAPRDHPKQVLTNAERLQLAEWILACADGQQPKDRVQVSAKVREILGSRHSSNKKRQWCGGSIKLNAEEMLVLQSKDKTRSTNFFQRFYPWCRAKGIKIEEGVARSQDETRAVKMTEAVVERHFHGEFGLEAELIDAGVMDPQTKVIEDPRRVLNSDETPQPIDAPQKGRRGKVAKHQGQAVRKATTTSKEILSINMTWGLCGHLYGMQAVLKLKELHSQLFATGPPGAASFDDETDLARKQTRTCTFSRTKDGMQTQDSYIQYLEQLDREITAHSEAAVAAGGTPIERPVVLCLDNHASRYSEEVLKACSGQRSRLGIRIFTEEPKTSGFLQSLDQYNATFHRRYNQGRDVYKTAYEARWKTPCTFGLPECIKVLGGDAELGLPGMWFSWANPYDVITAWRKVGIAGNVLAPELIDRSEFISQPAAIPDATPATPAAPTRKRAAELALTPDGMVSGSLESERAKVKALRAYTEEFEAAHDAPHDPTAAGILVPDVTTRPDKAGPNKRQRLTALHGSVTMRDVAGEVERRRKEVEAEAAAKDEKARARAEAKVAGEQEADALIAAFEACEHGCVCEVAPCMMAKWKRCPTCGPKSSLCKARACVAARKPLLLGYNPALCE